MDREAWRAAVHGVAKSWTWQTDWTELNWSRYQLMWQQSTFEFPHICDVLAGTEQQNGRNPKFWMTLGKLEWWDCLLSYGTTLPNSISSARILFSFYHQREGAQTWLNMPSNLQSLYLSVEYSLWIKSFNCILSESVTLVTWTWLHRGWLVPTFVHLLTAFICFKIYFLQLPF